MALRAWFFNQLQHLNFSLVRDPASGGITSIVVLLFLRISFFTLSFCYSSLNRYWIIRNSTISRQDNTMLCNINLFALQLLMSCCFTIRLWIIILLTITFHYSKQMKPKVVAQRIWFNKPKMNLRDLEIFTKILSVLFGDMDVVEGYSTKGFMGDCEGSVDELYFVDDVGDDWNIIGVQIITGTTVVFNSIWMDIFTAEEKRCAWWRVQGKGIHLVDHQS